MIQEVILLSENAKLPEKATTYSACWDLYSPEDYVIPAHKNFLIKTDIAVAWSDESYYMQLLSRSGMGYKNNVVVQCGVIDFDYRQNIGVLLQNNSDVDFIVKKHDRIAQYTYLKNEPKTETFMVSEFSKIDSNRTGGYGSTGFRKIGFKLYYSVQKCRYKSTNASKTASDRTLFLKILEI